jgi:lipopolysaccharide export system permease protein
MKTLSRYLAREIVSATVLVLIAFLGLFGFFDLIHELGDIGKGDYRLQHAALFVLLTVPGHVYELMPIAALIGAIYALAQLAAHSEVTVMRVSGLSTMQALRVVLTIGAIFAGVTFLFGEVVAPEAERAAQALRLKALTSVIAQEFRSGLWVKDGTRFVNVREVKPDTRLVGVTIYEFDTDYRLRSISQAREGVYAPPNAWTLTGVKRTVLGRANEASRIESAADYTWTSDLNPDILGVLLVQPDKMSLANLQRYTRHLEDNRQKTDRYDIALWKKVVYPLAILVMMALALPFAYMHARAGGVSLKIFAGIMLGLVFHLLNGLFAHLGAINTWPPFLSAVTPAALFMVLATLMLVRATRV